MRNFLTKMGTTFRKQIAHILKYMVLQQLGWRGVMFFFIFFLLYIVIFYTSCGIISALKADLVRGLFTIVETS